MLHPCGIHLIYQLSWQQLERPSQALTDGSTEPAVLAAGKQYGSF